MRDAGTSSGDRGGRGGNSGSAPNTPGDQGSGGAAASGGSAAPVDAGMSQEPAQTDAGRTMPVPCNGMCPADRPVCDESGQNPQCVQCTREDNHACVGETATCDTENKKCVQCTLDDARNCGEDTPVCNRSNHCVRCTSDRPNSCPQAQPMCDAEKRCVECLPGMANTCPFDRNICNSDGRCIECSEHADCKDSMRPRCDRPSNTCVGCETDGDCRDHFPTTPRCDKTSRTCQVCITEGDPTCGPGMFCDTSTATHLCAIGLPSQPNCTNCGNDADCGQSSEIAVCVENNSTKSCFAAAIGGICDRGYVPQSVPNRTTTQYCLPPAASSCPAISNTATKKACTQNDECGKNGLCPASGVCTFTCNTDQECPPSMTCDGQTRNCK